MNFIDLINKKRMGLELTDEEINYMIKGYLDGSIKDYQMSAMLMAIVLKGMTNEEIFSLTKYMATSSDMLDLSVLGDKTIDKHSTGGVGDKTTLIISPIVAACGVKVAKMSGRGLGHTGGTIDKLEAIPHFSVNLSKEDFIKQVNEIGVAITSQTENVAIADKKIYALRDATGTVQSIPLIASSIMSKKIALGTKKLVIDVKVGQGALMKTKEDALELARLMIEIGHAHGMQVVAMLTNMDIPLGNNIGNALEVEEAIDILKNGKKGNLRDICILLATEMVSLGLDISPDLAKDKVIKVLDEGDAYKKFIELVEYQHGDITRLPKAKNYYEIKASDEGYLTNIDAYKLGVLSMHLGAGRINKEDEIDYSAGIVLNKNLNDYVAKGDVLMTLYTNRELPKISDDIFKISPDKTEDEKLIIDIVK